MKTPQNFATEAERLNKLTNDVRVPMQDRVISLCRLYRLYQGDVHMQAKTVNRIEEIIKEL
jgi:hypothetical protein